MQALTSDSQTYMGLTKLSNVLNLLLLERKIKPMELARQTNVPQPTIQRLTAGTTVRPHLSSLEPIAKFFSISINQLMGLESIPWLGNGKVLNDDFQHIPFVDWDQVTLWLDTQAEERYLISNNTLICDANVSCEAFALTVKDSSMEPLFSIGTKVVIDPQKEYKDRCFVVVKLAKSNESLLRQLIMDGSTLFIKPLSNDLSSFMMHKIEKDDRICGVLVQAKMDFGLND